MTDYYAILGLEPNADALVIKERFRKLAKEYHPDLHPGDKGAEVRLKEINEAREVLGNPEKRAKYDAERLAAAGKKTAKHKTPTDAVDFSDLMGKFDSFFGKTLAWPSAGKKETNPLDASYLFNRYMGVDKMSFDRTKKK
jgi:molecular chaperone DnaJ